MGRKKSAKNKGQKSVRGHDENLTIRYRQVSKLIRVDKDGNPLDSTVKGPSTDKRALAKALIESGAINPPQEPHKPPAPPDNVLEFIRNKKPTQTATTGNEAETLSTAKTVRTRDETWDAECNKALRIASEAAALKTFRANWKAGLVPSAMHHETRKDKQGTALVLTKRDKRTGRTWQALKESSWNINKDRWKSASGHSLEKYRVSGGYAPQASEAPSKAVSAVPGTSVLARLNKGSGTALAPSGLPIKEFLEGGRYPPKSFVVYTKKAANESFDDWSAKSMLQWFIANVEVCHWSSFITDYVQWRDGEPLVDSGAVKAAVGKHEDRLLLKAMVGSLKAQHEAQMKEIESLSAARNLMEWELAVRMGDTESAEQFQKELYASAYAKPPENAEQVYNLYQSFLKHSREKGMPAAWSNIMFGSEKAGALVESHKDKIKFVEAEVRKLKLIKFRHDRKAKLSGYVKYPEIQRFRQAKCIRRIGYRAIVPEAVKAIKEDYLNKKISKWEMSLKLRGVEWTSRTVMGVSRSIYYKRLKYKQLEQDCVLFSFMGNKVTAENRKKPIPYQQIINKVVGVRSPCYTSPALIQGPYKAQVKYQRFMNKKAARYYLPLSTSGVVATSIKSLPNKLVQLLNTELNPVERGRYKVARQERIEKKAKKRQQQELIKEQRLAKEAAKRAYRMVH